MLLRVSKNVLKKTCSINQKPISLIHFRKKHTLYISQSQSRVYHIHSLLSL
jgi:hypothetical protein